MKAADLEILLREGEGTITFIENAGTGIKRIRDEVRAQGCPFREAARRIEACGFFVATTPGGAIHKLAPRVPGHVEGISSKDAGG